MFGNCLLGLHCSQIGRTGNPARAARHAVAYRQQASNTGIGAQTDDLGLCGAAHRALSKLCAGNPGCDALILTLALCNRLSASPSTGQNPGCDGAIPRARNRRENQGPSHSTAALFTMRKDPVR